MTDRVQGSHLVEVRQLVMDRCSGEMDPGNPNVRALVAFAQEIWGEYIRTHTLDEIREMQRQAEIDRQIRQRLFAGRVLPVVSWEMIRELIDAFGLTAVVGYDLDDPC